MGYGLQKTNVVVKLLMRRILLIFLFTLAVQLYSQSQESIGRQGELASYIGIKIDELISRFGPPLKVFAARGGEIWQDDVVFEYRDGLFYIFEDRVWQVSIKSAYDINVGDLKSVALLIIGDTAEDHGDYILYNFEPGIWPLAMRINIVSGIISEIFIFRSDY